jgi:hypothetical protein
LGRDAILSGDRVAAENYFQHGEHYYRLVQAAKQQAGESEQRDVRRPEQQNRAEPGNEKAAASSEEQSTAVAEEAVVEVTGSSPRFDAENALSSDLEAANVGEVLLADASAVKVDEGRETPMNPAELAAMSESGRKSPTGNSGNGRANRNRAGVEQDDNGVETAEAAPRRQSRRRRRPAANAAIVESDSVPVDVVEDVEPS